MTQDTCKQMSTKDWLITIVVLIIPVVGFIYLLIWALSARADGRFVSRKNMCLATLFMIPPGIMLLGFLSALALPVYAKYMQRIKFDDMVVSNLALRTQIERCVEAVGVSNMAMCTNGHKGLGWNIMLPQQYEHKFLREAVVTYDENAGRVVLNLKSTFTINGRRNFGEPNFNDLNYVMSYGPGADGKLAWQTEAEQSWCLKAEFCQTIEEIQRNQKLY